MLDEGTFEALAPKAICGIVDAGLDDGNGVGAKGRDWDVDAIGGAIEGSVQMIRMQEY